MQIEKNAVVSIDYTLTNDEGTVLDTSQNREPLSYIHGTGKLISGLEKELEGKQAGDSFQVSIAPEEGYGLRNEDLKKVIARSRFQDADKLETGMQFYVQIEHEPRLFSITHIEGDDVTIDGNHPLAGLNLNFEVNVVEVRKAVQEELEHGHVHGSAEEH